MSKSSLIIGLVAAAALHGLLFVPMAKPKTPKTPAARVKPKVTVAAVPPRPKAAPPAPKKPAPHKPQPKAAPRLRKVAANPAPAADKKVSGTTHSRDDKVQPMPPLRIAWTSPKQLRSVAHALSMPIVAVDGQARIIGQVADGGETALVEFRESLAGYSNRVRTLPKGFFGGEVARAAGPGVAELWILVPAELDRRWMDLQRQAIARAGLKLSQVRELEGRFEQAGRGFELRVTRVVSKQG